MESPQGHLLMPGMEPFLQCLCGPGLLSCPLREPRVLSTQPLEPGTALAILGSQGHQRHRQALVSQRLGLEWCFLNSGDSSLTGKAENASLASLDS